LETLTCGRRSLEQGAGRAAGMRDRRFRSGIAPRLTCLRGEPRGDDNYGCVAREEDVECRGKMRDRGRNSGCGPRPRSYLVRGGAASRTAASRSAGVAGRPLRGGPASPAGRFTEGRLRRHASAFGLGWGPPLTRFDGAQRPVRSSTARPCRREASIIRQHESHLIKISTVARSETRWCIDHRHRVRTTRGAVTTVEMALAAAPDGAADCQIFPGRTLD
jgi:hypothetical protein